MSWARYWATRASEALKARAATPLAARSWLTRPSSRPADPPRADTGCAVGRGGAGCIGAVRAATVVAAVDAIVRTASRPGPRSPTCNDRSEATCAAASGWVAAGGFGCDPRMLMVASANSGAPTSKTSLVNERGNSESPFWSEVASEQSRPLPATGPNRQAPEKPAGSAVHYAAV